MKTPAGLFAIAGLSSVLALAWSPLTVHAQATAATPAQTAAPAPASAFPVVTAKTVKVTMTQWQLRSPSREVPATLQQAYSVRAALDTTTNAARFEQFDVTAVQPGKAPAKPLLFVSDGKTQYELIGAGDEYTKGTAAEVGKPISSRLNNIGLMIALGWSKMPFIAAPDETLDGGKTAKVYTHVINRPGTDKNPVSMTYTIKMYTDPATNLPIRFQESSVSSAKPDVTTVVTRVDFADWKLNDSLDSKLFAWTPPAGVTEHHNPVLLTAGAQAPDFTAAKWGGGDLKLSDYKGKVVVLDFWATWCGPCQRSMPHVQKVAASINDPNVVVIGVCVWDEMSEYQKWVPKNKEKYTFQFAFDPAGRGKDSIATKDFGVSGIPTTYVIGKDGKVLDAVVGFSGDADHRLEAALGKAGINVPATTAVASK